MVLMTLRRGNSRKLLSPAPVGAPSPLVFSHVRILKGLQTPFVEPRILKMLRAANFGQNPKKRGVVL